MSAPEMNPPPPPERRDGGSCWKWGGIACAGCGCVAVLAIVVLIVVLASRSDVRNAYSRIVSTAQEAGEVVQRMQQVGEALDKFVQDHGRYPNKLAELAPRYVAAEMLRVSNKPGAKEFVYHKPPPNAPETFGVLEVAIPNPVMPTQAPPIQYVWTKAGKLHTPSAFQIEPEPSAPSPPEKRSEPESDPK